MLGNMGHSSPSNEAVTSRDRKRARDPVNRPRLVARLARDGGVAWEPRSPLREGEGSPSCVPAPPSQPGGQGVRTKGGFETLSLRVLEIFCKSHSGTRAERGTPRLRSGQPGTTGEGSTRQDVSSVSSPSESGGHSASERVTATEGRRTRRLPQGGKEPAP